MVEVHARILASCKTRMVEKCLSCSSGGKLKWVGNL
jgi:hypothetical protein